MVRKVFMLLCKIIAACCARLLQAASPLTDFVHVAVALYPTLGIFIDRVSRHRLLLFKAISLKMY